MIRHIKDHPKTLTDGRRTQAYLRIRRSQLGRTAKSKLLERPRPAGNGRLVQYLMIERGRRV